MGDDDRQGIRMTGADVDEVNVEPVDRRDELRQRIELRLHLPPVVVRAPVANELLQLGQLHALGSITDGLLVGPPRCQHALAKVGKRCVGNVDAERPDRGVVGFGSGGRR